MRILLDECVDWRLLRDLNDHDAKTVRQIGWSEIENDALLALAAAEFDIFITVDSNLRHPPGEIADHDGRLISIRQSRPDLDPLGVLRAVSEKSRDHVLHRLRRMQRQPQGQRLIHAAVDVVQFDGRVVDGRCEGHGVAS